MPLSACGTGKRTHQHQQNPSEAEARNTGWYNKFEATSDAFQAAQTMTRSFMTRIQIMRQWFQWRSTIWLGLQTSNHGTFWKSVKVSRSFARHCNEDLIYHTPTICAFSSLFLGSLRSQYFFFFFPDERTLWAHLFVWCYGNWNQKNNS